MSSNKGRATRRLEKHADDDRQFGFVFDALLATGVTITDVGEITIEVVEDPGTLEGASPSLTVANDQSNATGFTDDAGNTVPIGKAVLADVAGGVASTSNSVVYLVTIRVTTSDDETLAGGFEVEVWK
ncbi:MAG: hypothetical protein AAFZ07_20270 [Actinomycetota bacterium]